MYWWKGQHTWWRCTFTTERGQSWGLSSGDPGICVMSLTRSTPQRRQLGRTNGKLVTQVLGSPHRAFIIYWVVVIFIVAVDWIKNAWLLHWCICRFPCCGFHMCNLCMLSKSRTGAWHPRTWWANWNNLHSLAISPFSKNHKKLLLSVFSVCRPLYFYLTFLRQCCLHISICFIVTKERKLDWIMNVSLFRLLLCIPGGILCLLVAVTLAFSWKIQFSETPHPGQTYLDNLFNICSPWTGDQVLASEH